MNTDCTDGCTAHLLSRDVSQWLGASSAPLACIQTCGCLCTVCCDEKQVLQIEPNYTDLEVDFRHSTDELDKSLLDLTFACRANKIRGRCTL